LAIVINSQEVDAVCDDVLLMRVDLGIEIYLTGLAELQVSIGHPWLGVQIFLQDWIDFGEFDCSLRSPFLNLVSFG
jgi:hypothetical protein